MIKKHYYSWQDVEKMCVSIVNQMYKDNWRPDYIVGITRGGNVPATIISNITGIRCEGIKVSLRSIFGAFSAIKIRPTITCRVTTYQVHTQNCHNSSARTSRSLPRC